MQHLLPSTGNENENYTVKKNLWEIGPVINDLGRNRTSIHSGDFNLNLLEIQIREPFQEYVLFIYKSTFYQ